MCVCVSVYVLKENFVKKSYFATINITCRSFKCMYIFISSEQALPFLGVVALAFSGDQSILGSKLLQPGLLSGHSVSFYSLAQWSPFFPKIVTPSQSLSVSMSYPNKQCPFGGYQYPSDSRIQEWKGWFHCNPTTGKLSTLDKSR